MDYRRDIDGLRAVVVLPVILFHAGFASFSGGFVGVDVFFVISGFLITNLLIVDIQQGRFSIGHFYERRVRRILPALFVVILTCIPFAWLWMLPLEFKDFAGSLSIVVFMSNLYFMNEVDYFNTSAELQPLLHTWSLAVEEQYYLLFPPLLWLAYKGGGRMAVAVVTVLVAISLALAHVGASDAPDRTFFFSPARFWEIGVGSLCAFWMRGGQRKPHDGATLLGLILIAGSVIAFDRTTPSPSLWTVIPVAGAALVMIFGSSAGLSGRLLAARPVVWIGLISYSAYLWHQPLFAFARLRLLTEPSHGLMLGLSVLSLGLAWVTWRFVEQPFRRRARPVLPTRRALFGAFGLLAAGVFGFGLIGHSSNGLPNRLSDHAQVQAAFSDDRNPLRSLCLLSPKNPVPAFPVPGCGAPDAVAEQTPDVVIIGDSHNMAMAGQLQIALADAGLASYALGFSGCPSLGDLVQIDRPNPDRCIAYQNSIIDYARDSGARALVVAIRWPVYVHGVRYDNGEGGVETGPLIRADVFSRLTEQRRPQDPARQADVLIAMETGLRQLADSFALVVVDPVPEVGFDVPRIATICAMQDRTSCLNGHPHDGYARRNADILDMLGGLETEGLLTRVRTAPLFCDTAPGGRCRIFNAEGQPLYQDDDHLAHTTGARDLAPLIVDTVLGAVDGLLDGAVDGALRP
jgi:peptidoglycan/LPS O-acetylase OafA/YrhL